MPSHEEFTLDAKYRQQDGTIFLSGIQALVRLPLDQHRADQRRGVRTATLISGYRGSPLGGLDLTLERNPTLLAEHDVVFISGLNEDLGATAI
jgi:indolepyruvate ferredoxin oxidoreductase